MSLLSNITALRDKINTLTGENSVTPFAYTSEAYDADDANGHDDFVLDRSNNIPLATNSVIKLSSLVTNKGFRDQASSFPRMFINHFCGRVSYNLNKTVDVLSSLLILLSNNLSGEAGGIATLDSNGRVPDSQITEDLEEYKGAWNASTNTPNLNTVSKTKGDLYLVSVTGTQELVEGEGEVTYIVSDEVIYNGSYWQRIPSGDVDTINNVSPDSTGNINITGNDIQEDFDVIGTQSISHAISFIKEAFGLFILKFSSIFITALS